MGVWRVIEGARKACVEGDRGGTHIIHIHALAMPSTLHTIHVACRVFLDLIHLSLQLFDARGFKVLRLLCVRDLVADLGRRILCRLP